MVPGAVLEHGGEISCYCGTATFVPLQQRQHHSVKLIHRLMFLIWLFLNQDRFLLSVIPHISIFRRSRSPLSEEFRLDVVCFSSSKLKIRYPGTYRNVKIFINSTVGKISQEKLTIAQMLEEILQNIAYQHS